METQDEEDQGVRAHLAGRRGLARRTGRGERLRAWRLDGTLWNPAGAALIAAAQGRGFDLLLGRRTYDLWSGYWPKAPSSPMADGLNAARKYVATHRPESLAWGPFEGVGPDIIEGIRRIKSQDGPNLIVWGSSTLTSTLLAHGLAAEALL